MTDDPTQANPAATPGAEEPRVLGGRYEVGELVGRGGMADVHAGHDLRLGRAVAIKILRTDLARDSSFLARFRREAQAAAGLNHPSIVGVFDSGEELMREPGGAPLHVPYIVMEYVEGKTLRELLNEQRQLLPDEAARITAAVLSALEYAHERGLVHRDIKPANVMVTPSGGVKVMDFGIARALADTAATMTQTQAVMGTARYLSPEQAQGLDVDGRSDLYSVGCLLYELLAGRTPFQGDPVSLVYQHLGETPKAPSTHQSHLPQALDAITLHALEKNRDERYQSAADFRADLNAARADEPVSAGALASYNAVLGVAGAGAAAIARSRGTDERTQAVPRAGAGGAGPAAAGAAGAYAASGRRDPLPFDDDGPGYPQEEDSWERTDEMPVRERRHRGAALLLGALSLLAVAGVAWVLFQVLGPGGADEPVMVTVPNTVGMTEPQARTELTTLGFTVPEATERNSDQPLGQVIEQDPPAGELEEGGTVSLVVSAGPEAREIPDVAGMEEQAARDLLEREGFTNVRDDAEEVDDPDVERGHVVSTDPGAGEEVEPDREIVLSIASGEVDMPELVGQNQNAAVVLLNEAGLEWTITEERTAAADPGTVLTQSVEPGQRVAVGEEIALVVAAEPVVVETATETVTVQPPPAPAPSPTPPPSDPAPTTSEPTPTDEPTPTGTDPAEPSDRRGPPEDPPGNG
ncbi:Stk1 family PASTA domain-containing Ser/Thr kinase [Ornithinimicrobium pekingense]|uniref:non-specific serine/threonine protein kinase n=1 Tax=Ornithinimicrobium pekingense TaxID=384677 RepID=A0ABQ2F6E0_9MICO|nr:Stk1 family PASTA domain-containing Ser/Thr kinase [Ornithinimicrobium pekingense]GGK55819.1 protein kinase [Ornithinimicrobium pekingense]